MIRGKHVTIPDDLARWNYDTVLDIVTRHDFETGQFDFKAVLNPTKSSGDEKHSASIRCTGCSFANTSGGYILFGVQDPREKPGLPAEDLILGIPPSDLRKELGDKLQLIQPEIQFDAVPRGIPVPSDSQRVVFVAYIPLSPRRPHMYDGVFWRRGSGGKAEKMNVYEVREQMLNTEERRRKVTLLRLELLQISTVAEEKKRLLPGSFDSVVRFDASAVKSLVADVCVMLPKSSLIHDLQELLDIPLLTAEVNRELDKGITWTPRPMYNGYEMSEEAHRYFRREDMDKKLIILMEQCSKAEKRFASVFGPLGESVKTGQ